MRSRLIALTALLTCILLTSPGPSAWALWSSDAAANLSVADGAGEQILPKVAPTADGGCYVSWFDNGTGGYDVRIQKLDTLGNEIFAHNGVLVADRGFSWVMDYGLDVDSAGNALVTFRDDRLTGEQITAAKVSPTGTLLWGDLGVQLTSTTAFIASPKVAGTSDGGVVVAWTQDSDTWLQKLDSAGAPLWGAGILMTPMSGSYSVSDLHDAGSDVIVSIVHEIAGFGSPRHIVAQKLDAAGDPLWGMDPLAVFDDGSLQIGNFPPFTPDGSGGAVFAWYDTATLQLQCYAQHITPEGSEAFPHNGAAVSTNATRVRVSPAPTFDPGSGETIVFWVEENSSQSQFGVYGQKFDAVGGRQWSDQGTVVVAVGTDEISLVRTLRPAGETFVFWSRAPSFGQDRLYGARIDDVGGIDLGPFDVASTPSGKSRLDVALSASGFAILAWNDERNGAADILAQNVNADGTLGIPGVGVGDALAGGSLSVAMPYPNPSRGAVSIEIAGSGSILTGQRSPGLTIYDLQGRLVRILAVPAAPGSHLVTWDGRNERGTAVPAGVYFARLDGRNSLQRITLMR